MTFDEALKAKNEISATITEGTYIFKTIIVPENENDYSEYRKYYRISNFDDNSAKAYSKDESYIVCGLWTNGKDVARKFLKR
ncbi:hypothetical protein [Flavobacterium sp. ZB4R12]|uniref:hypothetical protein n=1 Tax=Flavobacterium sp. ZB4R12 TaxID=3398732 RepID=UPI003AABE93D